MLKQLTLTHVTPVSMMLSRYFDLRQSLLGTFLFYQTSFQTIKKHVQVRLSDLRGPIKYYGIMKGDKIKGFVNYFENKSKKALEIRCLIDEGLTQEEKKALVQHCIDKKEKLGFAKITAEFADCDDHFAIMFAQNGAKWVSSNYVLQ